MKKLNANTSLKAIKRAVFDDFGVVIDNDDAKEIRDAKRQGCALWTPARLTLTSGQHIQRISAGKIQARNGATYTSKEWNS